MAAARDILLLLNDYHLGVLYKIKLKNSEKSVLLDDQVFEVLNNDPYFHRVALLDNLRLHSSGCAVFQKTWRKADGGYKTETIYLHKLVAERFLPQQRSGSSNLVGAKNGNKLDCRLENIEWRSRSVASRKRKTSSKVGYTGVYKENNKYRALISVDGKPKHIGMYDTPEEAALAYNRVSLKIFGENGKQNIIRRHRS